MPVLFCPGVKFELIFNLTVKIFGTVLFGKLSSYFNSIKSQTTILFQSKVVGFLHFYVQKKNDVLCPIDDQNKDHTSVINFGP